MMLRKRSERVVVVEIVGPGDLHGAFGFFPVLLPVLGELGAENIQICVVKIELEGEVAALQFCQHCLCHADVLADGLNALLELGQVVDHDFLVLELQHPAVLLAEPGELLADPADGLEEALVVGLGEGLFEEPEDVLPAVAEVEGVLEPEGEVEQFLLGEAGEGVEELHEGLVELVDEVVDGLGGEEEVLDFLGLGAQAVLVLVEHEDVPVGGLVEDAEAVVADVELGLLLAALEDEDELLVEVLDDLVELRAVLDQLEDLLVDLADVAGAGDRLQHPHVPRQLLHQLLDAGGLLAPVLRLEAELLDELLEDLLVHAALEDLQQPLEVGLVPGELLQLALVLAGEVVVHHELHLLDLDDVVLDLLALRVLVADLEAHLSADARLEVVVELLEDEGLGAEGLLGLLQLLLAQVLVAVEEGDLGLVVPEDEGAEGVLLLGEVALVEVGVVLLLARLPQHAEHAVHRDDALLDQQVGLLDAPGELLLDLPDVGVGRLGALDVVLLELAEGADGELHVALDLCTAFGQQLRAVPVLEELGHGAGEGPDLGGLLLEVGQQPALLALLAAEVLAHDLVLAYADDAFEGADLPLDLEELLVDLVGEGVEVVEVGEPVLEVGDEFEAFGCDSVGEVEVVVLEDVSEEEALEDVGDDVVGEGDVGLEDVGDEPVVLLLAAGDVEDEAVEDAVGPDQEGLQLQQQVLAVGEEVDALEGELVVLAAVELLVELEHVGLEALHDLQQRLEVLQVVLLLGELLGVDAVDVDGGVDLGAVDAVVVVADDLDVGEVGLEGALEEDEDVLLVGDHLALLLHALLLDGQLLDAVGDLVADAREAAPDLLVVLQHQQVLVDRLEEALPELLDLVGVDDVAPQQLLRDVHQHPVAVLGEPLAQRALEDLEVDLVGEQPLQRRQLQPDRVLLPQVLQHVLPQRLLADHIVMQRTILSRRQHSAQPAVVPHQPRLVPRRTAPPPSRPRSLRPTPQNLPLLLPRAQTHQLQLYR